MNSANFIENLAVNSNGTNAIVNFAAQLHRNEGLLNRGGRAQQVSPRTRRRMFVDV
jgi:hypothetical protein